jgi:uncharacterized damage-inducible protein DinB
MAETQREPVPLNDDGELGVAHAFLSFQRHCVVKKCDGLSDEQLRRVLVGSGTSLLGLVQHLTVAERYWFGDDLLREQPEEGWDWSMTVPADRAAADLIADYHAAIEASDAAIRTIGDPAAVTARIVRGRPRTLRWLLAHMTNEVARHAGHADVLRELLDGVTGR